MKLMEGASCLTEGSPKHDCPSSQLKQYVTEKEADAILSEMVLAQETIKHTCCPSKVTLYRGMTGEIPKDGRMPVRVLSSWTMNREWAEEIIRRRPEDGYVVKKDFDISRVVAFSPVGGGMSAPEAEVVLYTKDGFENVSRDEIVSQKTNHVTREEGR
jgi:hypothetical protein